MANRNIILVGFMGTGKSTVGRLVADRLNYSFVDMDDVIESRAGKKISDIFAEEGEPAFRRAESELARELSEKEHLVVAAGGGIVLDPGNITAFSSTGLVMCLTASEETILRRVEHAQHRPLLEDGEKVARIRELLAARKALYHAFPHRVDTDGLSAEEVAERVLRHFEEPG